MQAIAKPEPNKLADSPALQRFSKSQAAIALVLISSVFIASAIYSSHAGSATGQYFTICIFKSLAGLPCPFCGLSHSFIAMAGGDLAGAFKFNLLGPPVFLILILTWIRSLGVLLNKPGFVFAFDKTARQVRIIRSLAIAFGLFGAMRILWLLMFH